MAERQLNGSNLLLYRGTGVNNAVSEITVGNHGDDYDSTPVISFTGGGGTGAAATAIMAGVGSNQTVDSVLITNTGTGYTSAPTVVFTGGNPSTAATATAVLGEGFELMACALSSSIDQSSQTLSTDTKCGKLTLAGTKDAKVPFSFIPNLSPAAGKVAMETWQADYNAGSEHNYKLTTVSAVTGDPLFEFAGYVESLKWDAPTNDFFKGDGNIQVNEDLVTLTIL